MFSIVSMDSNVFIDLDINCNASDNAKNNLIKKEDSSIVNDFKINTIVVDDKIIIDTDTEIDFSIDLLKFFNIDFDVNINFDVIFNCDDLFFDIIFDINSSIIFNNDVRLIIFFELDLYDKNNNGSMFEFNYETQKIDNLL